MIESSKESLLRHILRKFYITFDIKYLIKK